MLRTICTRRFRAGYLSGEEGERENSQQNAWQYRPRQENMNSPNYFGSFCGKSSGSREEAMVAHMCPSRSSRELSREAAGRKDPCGSIKMIHWCAHTANFNLCTVSRFCSFWSSSDHSCTVLLQQVANRHLHGRKIPGRSPRQKWLPDTCFS